MYSANPNSLPVRSYGRIAVRLFSGRQVIRHADTLNQIQAPMRYHDWHLDGYSVADRGKSVVLHLLWDYPGQSRERSDIRFSDVALYHFTHTGGAIVTDIDEIPVANLIDQIAGELAEWSRLYGLNGWRSSVADYEGGLKAAGLKAWRIESAIGFSGFVVAREVE